MAIQIVRRGDNNTAAGARSTGHPMAALLLARNLGDGERTRVAAQFLGSR